ncbi:MAG: MOSC domain-containing protein [Candidatus Obscuribacterales bacterium]
MLHPDSIRVTAINLFPVKSLGGIALSRAEIDHRGLLLDRAFMVVKPDGNFLTQREIPKMSLVEVEVLSFETGSIKLSAPGMAPITIGGYRAETPTSTVTVWGDDCQAVDQGDEAGAWLSAFLARDCRLVRMADSHRRSVRHDGEEQNTIAFQDGYPLLIISEASLRDLNERLPEPVLMNRFRPNIVIEGCQAFQEDSFKSIRIGSIHFDLLEPCARCTVTTIDQATAGRGQEPLRTLSSYRQKDNKVLFGMNAVHRDSGVVKVGDLVEIMQ